MGVSAQCKIGTTSGNMTAFSSLGISAPLVTDKPAADVQGVVSGGWVRRGFAEITMEWAGITQKEIEALRAYCSTASATAYISAPFGANRAYTSFQSIMVWPKSEFTTKFIIRFTHLVAL